MAKKQQIILTHGTNTPGADVVKGLKLGEVLVQHAAEAKDAALHTTLKEGEDAVLVSFPSKEWVNAAIDSLKTGDMNTSIEALSSQIEALDAAYKRADAGLKDAYEAEDKAIREAFAAADKGLKEALEAKDAEIAGTVSGLSDSLDALEGTVGGHTAELATINGEGAGSIKKAKADAEAAAKNYTDAKIGTLPEGKADVMSVVATKADAATVTSSFDAVNSAIDILEGTVGGHTAELATINGEGAGSIKKAKADAEAYADAKIGTLAEGATVMGVVATKADADRVETLEGVVETVVGADTGKSMRNVAAEEVAKVVAEAPESLDTLKEIADWIQNDTTGAAGMANDIEVLQQITAGYTGNEAIKTAISTVDGRVDDNVEALNVINGEGAGSIKKAQADAEATAKNYTDTEVGKVNTKIGTVAEGTTVMGVVATKADAATVTSSFDAVNAALNVINGEGEGSIKKAQADAMAYTDAEIGTLAEGTTVMAEVAKVEAKIGTLPTGKADVMTVVNELTATVGSNNDRLVDVEEAYVKTIKINEQTFVVGTNDMANIVDLSEMIIDGGTY